MESGLSGSMFGLAARHRTPESDASLGVVLAFVAGAINAGGFLAIGVYTSHMSGMISAFADHIVLGEVSLAGFLLAYVVAFLGGSVSAGLMVLWARQQQLQSEFALPLMVEALCLLIFGILASRLLPWVELNLHGTILTLCYIMGLQNALITKVSHAEIRTTHMTGVVTDLGIEAARWLHQKLGGPDGRFHPHKMRLLLKLLGAFSGGGLIGAYVFSHAGFISVIAFSGLLAFVAAPSIWQDIRSRLSSRP